MKQKRPMILRLSGSYAEGELVVDGTRLQLDREGRAKVYPSPGAHYIQHVAVGSPGSKVSLHVHLEGGGELWRRELHIPRDGLVVGTKKFRILDDDDDEWGGYRFSG